VVDIGDNVVGMLNSKTQPGCRRRYSGLQLYVDDASWRPEDKSAIEADKLGSA
jgi:hypothetical protein